MRERSAADCHATFGATTWVFLWNHFEDPRIRNVVAAKLKGLNDFEKKIALRLPRAYDRDNSKVRVIKPSGDFIELQVPWGSAQFEA